MMHECKRILNKQVAGEGLWHAELARGQGHQEGDVAEVRGADGHSEHSSNAASASEHDDGEDNDKGRQKGVKEGAVFPPFF